MTKNLVFLSKGEPASAQAKKQSLVMQLKNCLLVLIFLLSANPASAGQVYLKCKFKDILGVPGTEEVTIDPDTNEAYVTTAIYASRPQVQAVPLISSEKYTLKFSYDGNKFVYEISRIDGTYSAFEPSKMVGSLSGVGGYLAVQEASVYHAGTCKKAKKADVPKQLF